MTFVKMVSVMLVALMVVAAPLMAESRITCLTMKKHLAPCLGYLRRGGSLPKACCTGVQAINKVAQTTKDRRTACRCIKTAFVFFPDINLDSAAALPADCGVDIPYKISPTFDCRSVIVMKSMFGDGR